MTVTYWILGITVLVSIWAFSRRDVFEKLLLSPYRTVRYNEWYRVISHGFIHADYLHLFVNMFVLYSFGKVVESYLAMHTAFPVMHYMVLYFGGMIAASVSSIIKYREVPSYRSVGASGAISAVLFAYIFFEPRNMLYLMGILPIPGIIFGVLYLWYSSYMSKRGGDNINHDAHFYGSVFGFLYPLLIDPSLIVSFFNKLTAPLFS